MLTSRLLSAWHDFNLMMKTMPEYTTEKGKCKHDFHA
jgi:hypothetical protein